MKRHPDPAQSDAQQKRRRARAAHPDPAQSDTQQRCFRYGARRLLTPKRADIKSSEPCSPYGARRLLTPKAANINSSEYQTTARPSGSGAGADAQVRLFDVRFPVILGGQQTACAISEAGFPRARTHAARPPDACAHARATWDLPHRAPRHCAAPRVCQPCPHGVHPLRPAKKGTGATAGGTTAGYT